MAPQSAGGSGGAQAEADHEDRQSSDLQGRALLCASLCQRLGERGIHGLHARAGCADALVADAGEDRARKIGHVQTGTVEQSIGQVGASEV
jgi:hypothetical protein